jgi:uncharacterized protein (TIGR02453 family)
MKTAAFKGFPPEGVAFMRALGKNNNREWFQPRLETYKEQVRTPMLDLVSALHVAMLRFAPAYVGEPAKCLYRVYRDVRFSKDKTPYKTRADALFWRNSLGKDTGAAFYIAVSPEEVSVCGGLYMPTPAVLLAVRQHILANSSLFRSTFESKPVRRLMGELTGQRTTRVPKGFCAEDPAAELLKYKRYVLNSTLSPEIITGPSLFREIVKRFEAMTPFIEFLDAPLVRKSPAPRN